MSARDGGRPGRGRSGSPAAYRLHIEYEGTRFAGWQRQGEGQTARGVRTVAGTLERVLAEGGFRSLGLGGSGRTDAGVHALGQVAHLHLDRAVKPIDLQRLFDEGLPSDVAVQKVVPCAAAFHARHDATARTYLYQLALRRTGLAKPFVWWVKGALRTDEIRKAWASFTGFQHMGAFADLEDADPRCRITACESLEHGSLLLLRVTASHFLRKQVRRMVGAAVACGLGKARREDILRDLERPSPQANLAWSGLAAAASGLFLEHVQYPGEPEPPPLIPATRLP